MEIPFRIVMSVELNSGGYRMPQYFEFAVPIGPHRTNITGWRSWCSKVSVSAFCCGRRCTSAVLALSDFWSTTCVVPLASTTLASGRHNYTCTFTLSEALSSSGFDSGVVLSSGTRQQQHCLFQYTVTNKAACKSGRK